MIKTSAIILSLWLVSQAGLNTITGKVVAVNSGDTLTVSMKGQAFKIRLAEVDSPDVKQPFFRQALNFTKDLVLDKQVSVHYHIIDGFGTIIGEVVLSDGSILNGLVVQGGFGWHYKVHPEPREDLSRWEYEAWKGKLGLWVQPKPTPPWIFRKEKRELNPPNTAKDMDYDQILSYGLEGNRKTRKYQWPGCANFKKTRKPNRIVFLNKLQAEALGYKLEKSCLNR